MLKTKVVKIDPENVDLKKISLAAEVIKKGGLVAFPTETVYGLGADFFNQEAVKRIFAVKKRPPDKPLTVQIADIGCLDNLTGDLSPLAYQLMSRFWPGPLTLVLPAKAGGKIGVRIPANKIAQSLIKMSQTALVVPSANLSGETPAQTAEDVLQVFDGIIEMVIDAGGAELATPSTVVDLTVSPYKILRPGPISQKDIQSV